MKWATYFPLVLLLAVASTGMAAEPQGAQPSAISCGDSATCNMGTPAVQVINNGTGEAIRGQSTTSGVGVRGIGRWGIGVRGTSNIGAGVAGKSVTWAGVQADSTDGVGLRAQSINGSSIYVPAAGRYGIEVGSAALSGIYVHSAGWEGIEVNSAGYSGLYIVSSGVDAIRIQTAGNDGLRFFEGVGRDYIRAGSDADLDFRVLGTGEVHSDVGYYTPASDFAEMMDVEGSAATYAPGDVLVVSDAQDRSVELASSTYSRAVIGVYSTQPGFVGGQPVSDDEAAPDIPVAIVGIVPCKVSTENGAIHRGDLLVTSATPGHAMRADDPPPGTILGKALEPLDEGTGVILVLVTLQ